MLPFLRRLPRLDPFPRASIRFPACLFCLHREAPPAPLSACEVCIASRETSAGLVTASPSSASLPSSPRSPDGEQELREQELREQELGEQELREQELTEQELTEQELREQELREQEVTEQELREQELREQGLTEPELREQKLTEQELREQELMEHELRERERREPERREPELREQELRAYSQMETTRQLFAATTVRSALAEVEPLPSNGTTTTKLNLLADAYPPSTLSTTEILLLPLERHSDYYHVVLGVLAVCKWREKRDYIGMSANNRSKANNGHDRILNGGLRQPLFGSRKYVRPEIVITEATSDVEGDPPDLVPLRKSSPPNLSLTYHRRHHPVAWLSLRTSKSRN
ncbi:hypothetical protein BV898_17410 [Hypsibius exemplaris]|uniref:Uncharacterized protein n=1 Tax=Hypsibius exemplaris TaxID=2072580 RepID=A0A9X6RMJ4_HYPEX|nr:hypothetical protein BV898_17410 [Hypsibius exemplaris]